MKPLLCFLAGHRWQRVLTRERLGNGIWLNVWSARCRRCGCAGLATGREEEAVVQ